MSPDSSSRCPCKEGDHSEQAGEDWRNEPRNYQKPGKEPEADPSPKPSRGARPCGRPVDPPTSASRPQELRGHTPGAVLCHSSPRKLTPRLTFSPEDGPCSPAVARGGTACPGLWGGQGKNTAKDNSKTAIRHAPSPSSSHARPSSSPHIVTPFHSP